MDSKERIIALLQFLRENTDEETSVSSVEIRRMFRERGESLTTPTLRDDIASMKKAGLDIDVNEINGVGTYYKYLDREWSEPELQILIDAVSASQFITCSKSDLMIAKLMKLAGPSQRRRLAPSIMTSRQVKAPNEQILYIVQTIREAIRKNCRIRFRYDSYTPDLELIPKHDGYIYEVSPYAMIWKADRYYLVGWSEKHGAVTHFRIDRMELPRLTAGEMHPVPENLRLEDRSDKIFSMFDGPEETVVLRFRPHLMNAIVTRFGTDLRLSGITENSVDVTVSVHLSPTFYGWLFQYAGEMIIAEPDHVRREYTERLRTAISGDFSDSSSSLG